MPIGTYGILSALQNMVTKGEFISVNFYGQNRCEIDRILEINNQFHIIKIRQIEEEDTISNEYNEKSKNILNLIQQIYINADQPTKYAIDLLKSNYDLSKPSELFFYSMVVLTLSQ